MSDIFDHGRELLEKEAIRLAPDGWYYVKLCRTEAEAARVRKREGCPDDQIRRVQNVYVIYGRRA